MTLTKGWCEGSLRLLPSLAPTAAPFAATPIAAAPTTAATPADPILPNPGSGYIARLVCAFNS